MADVGIVGAGIAGLVAAKHIALAGHNVTVFEKKDSIGGRLSTRVRDGFTLDRGFQVLFTGYPGVRKELDLDALTLCPYSPGAVMCGEHGRSVFVDPRKEPTRVPEMFFGGPFGLKDALAFGTLQRTLRNVSRNELFEHPDESTESWLFEQGFTPRFCEHFFRPFLGGILLDRSLTTSANVTKYILSNLFRGETVVPESGMQAIPAQLAHNARGAGVQIKTESPVSAIQMGTNPEIDVAGQIHEKDAVIVATDPGTAEDLTGINTIPTEGKAVVTQYYAHTADPLDAGKMLLLNTEGGAPNHLVQQSVVAPAQAPSGSELLSATFIEDVAATDTELFARTQEALHTWYPERELDLSLIATDRIDFAQFTQSPGIHATLPAVQPTAEPLYLAGEYTTWSGIDGAIESGQIVANTVTDGLAD